MNLKLILSILVCTVNSWSIYCSNNYSFQQISITEGLTQSTVTALLRDTKGSLWIGTRNGLNRFYKNQMDTYQSMPGKSNSIVGNHIHYLIEDNENRIWIATSEGLCCLDPVKNECHRESRDVFYSAIGTGSGIFFGGRDFMLFYDYNTGTATRIGLAKVLNPENKEYIHIVDIKQPDSDCLILATNHNGLFCYDIKKEKVTQLDQVKIPFILSLHLTPQGEYFVSSFKNGFFHLATDGSLIRQYNSENSNLSNDIIMGITQKDSILWLGTDGGGINTFNLNTKQIDKIHLNENRHSIAVNSITKLYLDGKFLWAGTVRNGAICIQETYARNYKNTAFMSGKGLSNNAVMSLEEDSNGTLWVGTDGGGINRYNPYTHEFTHYPATRQDKVEAIADLSRDKLLVSLFSEGLFLFDKNKGTYSPFLLKDNRTNYQSKGYVTGLLKAAPDKIYIFSKDVYTYHTDSHSFEQITEANNHSMNALNPSTLCTGGGHCFIVGEWGIYTINQQTDQMNLLLRISSGERINTLACGSDSVLWIGSNTGLSSYDFKTGKLKKVETKLFNIVSKSVIAGNKLWICADNEFYTYLTDENRFIVWSESDGFLRNEILVGYKNKHDERIYLGGTEGLIAINSSISLPDNTPPVPILHNVDLNGKSHIDNLVDQTIRIPYNYTSLSVHVDVNEQDLFRNSLIRYTIRGNTYNAYESYDNVLNLPSLSPGYYDIYASCNTKSGEWTEPVLLLTVEVAPAWYNTTLASIGFLGLFFIVVTLFVSGYIARKRKKMKIKIDEHKQIMHENKIQFLINISHELRTPLTLIYSPLKRLLSQPVSQEKLHTYLNGMYLQAKEMKRIIDMTLDVGKLDAGSKQLILQEHEINKWVRKVCKGFENEYEEAKVTIRYNLDEGINTVVFDEARCSIVLYNLMMNALKFSPQESVVTVSSRMVAGFIEISVDDRGIGLSHVDKNKLFTNFYQGSHNKGGTGIGLSYSRQLIDLHGGSIKATNNEHNGASFTFSIPLGLEPTIKNTIPVKEEQIPTEKSSYDFSGYSIIIIEDYPELALYMKDFLEPLFHKVYIAHNGKEGLNMIIQHKPNIIISDVMMPVMDGFLLCKTIKENIEISHIPVILLTAKSDSDSISAGYKRGADVYLSKPFTVETILAVANNLLEKQQTIREMYQTNHTIVNPKETTISTADETFMTRLNNLIKENINNEELNVDFLTINMSMSRTSLYNKIKQITGMGVNDYINKIRIEEACNLLINTDKDITEITYALGFSYQRSFSTLFKKVKKMSPTAYRTTYK